MANDISNIHKYNSITNKTNGINQKIFTYTSPNINKITKDINLSSKDNSFNTYNTLNNNKNMKLNILPHSLSLDKNIQLQPPNNIISKIMQSDRLKNFYNFYEKENSKKFESNEELVEDMFKNYIKNSSFLRDEFKKKPVHYLKKRDLNDIPGFTYLKTNNIYRNFCDNEYWSCC